MSNVATRPQHEGERKIGPLVSLRAVLPKGGTLPADVWRSRHRGIMTLLWLHVPGLFVFALIRGNTVAHSIFEASIVALPAMAATYSTDRHRTRASTIIASVGLMTASGVLVHLSGGMIEAHFHFFVMVGVVVLYQDWRPFLVAIAFVVLHHGTMGALSPRDVYDHPAAWERPWLWAVIHGVAILGMSAAGIANWKLNERSQSLLARMAAIVESSDDAIYGWTIEGTINSWNRGAVDLYGYTRAEMLGRPFILLVPSDRAGEAARMLDRIRRGERIEPFDSERLRKDGSLVEVSVNVSAVRNRDGDVVGGATIARDITERHQADEALQHTLSLLAATLESTADGVLVVDPDGRISSFNGKFAEMWRVPASLLEARDDSAVLASVLDQLVDPAVFVTRVNELYVNPEEESHDTLNFKDGRVFERSSKPQRVGGAIVGRVWSFHDLTDRKRLEAELAEARDDALEASRLKSDFLATMSHEIRTPMNGVIGLTGLLLDTGLTDTQRQYADGVRASGEALLGIINDILDFSKIEAGKLELEMSDFDLAPALDEVVALVAESARAKGLALVAEYDAAKSIALLGDVGRLRQILLNLVGNAVKFTDTGRVTLRVVPSAEPTDLGTFGLRIEVSDTGPGLAESDRVRLFEPFSQADASTTRRFGGTGLGLAICARLAAEMGGEIGVESTLGKGSTFWVEIPFERSTRSVGSAATAAGSPPVPRREPRSAYLLVVEDNAINQLVAKEIVGHLGYRCDVAANGVEALEALARRDYAVVLMDCYMPEMDGFAATMELRRREGDLRHTPVIAMTAAAMAEDQERCVAAGMDDYVTKPVSVSRLESALSRWVAEDKNAILAGG